MRGIVVALMALCLATAGPVAAQDSNAPGRNDGYAGVACTPHDADWQMVDASATPPTSHVDVPAGTNTSIFGCKVGGHAVRINFVRWPIPSYRCGVADDIEVSAWVDGMKVVDRRQAGDLENCLGHPDSDWQVWRILINDKMHLTICERQLGTERDTPYIAAELKPGQISVPGQDSDGNLTSLIGRCTLTLVALDGGSHDPYFDGEVIRRTPIGVDLAGGTANVCQALIPAMSGLKPDALRSPLTGHTLTHMTGNGKPYDTASEADRSTGEIGTYALDVDGDGVTDTVTYQDLPWDDDDVDFPGQYSWTSGRTGKTVILGGTTLHDDQAGWPSKVYTDPVRGTVSFIAVDGHVYAYKADNLLMSAFIGGNVTELESVSGAQDWNETPSRHLYTLHPDGTADETCTWRARKRPEEFL